MTTTDSPRTGAPRGSALGKLRRAALVLATVLMVALVAFWAWARHVATADGTAYAAALADPRVEVASRADFITVRPAGRRPEVGLLFYPGARVAPEAYLGKMGAVAHAANLQVVIGRPPLNLAPLSINQADAMRAAIPEVTRWYVGGHSLGGATACWYAKKHRSALEGVVLLGTYCGSDLSASSLRVLVIAGDRDGLFPPDKIIAHRRELPPTALSVTIPGMNHAELGNYGPQPGDREPTIDDAAATAALAGAISEFFGGTPSAARPPQ